MDDVFVGRGRELAAIDALIGRTVKGAVGAIVFVGEPGIGKSRLLREAERRFSPRLLSEPRRRCPDWPGDGGSVTARTCRARETMST